MTSPDQFVEGPAEHQVRPGASIEKLLYSVREAAEMLSIGRVKLYELMAAGKIESVKLDGSRRIPRDALEDFISRLRAQSNEYY